jgi:membrane protein DedA with SNARE-associated domain
VSGWVGDVISSFGARGLAALMVLENLFPPIPSEVVLLLLAGFLVGRGELGFAEALAAITLGSLVRALALYALGRWADGASCCATGPSCG